MENEIVVMDHVANFAMQPDAMSNHLKQMREFVSSQLKDGLDYGPIKGCGKKPSLFKAGAEKLNKLFGFKIKMTCVERVLDREDQFVMYEYTCEIGKYADDGTFYAFGQSSGVCSTEENKYKYRNEWANGIKTQVLNDNPFNLANTICKMAQKRAFVGASLLACGASEYYTQDIEDDPSQYQKRGGSQQQQNTNDNQSGSNDSHDYISKCRERLTEIVRQAAPDAAKQLDLGEYMILKLSEFQNKEGEAIPGKKTLGELSEGRLKVLYGKLKDPMKFSSTVDDWLDEQRMQQTPEPVATANAQVANDFDDFDDVPF